MATPEEMEQRRRNRVYQQYGRVGLGGYDLAQGAAEGTRNIGRGLKGAYDFVLGPWVREGKNAVGGLGAAIGIGDDAGNVNAPSPTAPTSKPAAPAGQQPKPALGDAAKPAPAAAPESTTISGPGGFKARRTQNDDGTYTLTMGKPNEAGYGTMTYSRQRAPGSNFEYAGRRETMRGGNYGYDPQEARQAQAGPEWMRQAGPNTWTGSGFTFQGNAGDARRFLAEAARQKLHGADAPVSGNDTFLKYRQMELARQNQPQLQMPEAPEGGWQTKLRAYQTQMDAYNQALNRQQAMEIARMGDARQGGQLGFQQDQLRQQLMLDLMGHDLQVDQNAVNRAKALAEMQAAALGMQSQQAQLGLQQGVMDAFANGTPEEQESMTRLYQALYGKGKTSDKATRSPWRYVPGKGDDEGAAAGMLVNQETGETRVVDGMTPAQQYYYGVLYPTLPKETRDALDGSPAPVRNAAIEQMYRKALADQEKNKKKK